MTKNSYVKCYDWNGEFLTEFKGVLRVQVRSCLNQFLVMGWNTTKGQIIQEDMVQVGFQGTK